MDEQVVEGSAPSPADTTMDHPRRVVVVLGSSRSDGNTRRALDQLLRADHVMIFDLNTAALSPYDYGHGNDGDPFLKIATAMAHAPAVVFATPVYWYTMSAQMKTFFDRFTDLLQTRRSTGRALNGQSCLVVASGSDPKLPSGFEQPFALTCRYFGMSYLGAVYCQFQRDGRMAPAAERRAKRRMAKLLPQTSRPRYDLTRA